MKEMKKFDVLKINIVTDCKNKGEENEIFLWTHTHQKIFSNNKRKIVNKMIYHFEKNVFYVCVTKHYLFMFVPMQECLFL